LLALLKSDWHSQQSLCGGRGRKKGFKGLEILRVGVKGEGVKVLREGLRGYESRDQGVFARPVKV
jgi:hypothetical protein